MSSTITVANTTIASRIPGLQDLWDITLGCEDVLIAILDGECDRTHPNLLAANITPPDVLRTNRPNHGAAVQHGTHVASIILGQHQGDIQGIAPQCRGLSIPIFTDGQDGSLTPCSQVDLARAMLTAANQGAQVINISGGQLTPSGEADLLLTNAVRHCADQNILIVSAVGNDGCDCLHIPGAMPSVLAVGAMNGEGNPLGFSNWGKKYRTQGILALGQDIIGAVPGGETAPQTGTSYATAIVSGVAALLLSLQVKQGQRPDPKAVKAAILQSAIACDDQPIEECDRLLAGRLNIQGALSIIRSPGTSMHETTDLQTIHPIPDEAKASPSPMPRQPAAIQAASYSPAPAEAAVLETDSPRSPQSLTQISPSAIQPAACSCEGGGGTPAQLVYALGTLGYDFATEARRDSIQQHMGEGANPNDPQQLLRHFNTDPWDAADILWTLSLDATPIYVVMPQGAYAERGFARLLQFLREQLEEGVERVSIPGIISGQAMLMSGQVVPVILPTLRCMYSWTTSALVEAVCGSEPDEAAAQGVTNFLERVYYELRNLGITPQDRAINYAATNAFNIERIFESAMNEDIELESIDVEKSPLCRPGADCWDVKLTFFHPQRVFEQARKCYRFTVDVSDICPVSVGRVRSWFVR